MARVKWIRDQRREIEGVIGGQDLKGLQRRKEKSGGGGNHTGN